MPEIKHQFTSGKMNKDLDERLVPNGEYRDAMNIQVSTSEGSDVGTIQNILGNEKIDGPDWTHADYGIQPPSERCIASVADEKNDVGYYFIAGGENYTPQDWGAAMELPEWGTYPWHNPALFDFERDMIVRFDGTTTTPVFVDPFLKTAICSKSSYISPPGMIILNAANNPFEIEVGDIITRIETKDLVYDGLNIPILTIATGKISIQDTDVIDTALLNYILASAVNTVNQFRVVIDRRDSRVLKFDVVENGARSINKLITGINIIDDLLFWTDGYTEPKKINIDRSIKGTVDAFKRTKIVINDVVGSACEESHIAVIKKNPNKAPTISALTSFRQGKIFSEFTTSNTFGTGGDPLPDGSIKWIAIDNFNVTSGNLTGTPISFEVGDVLRFTNDITLLPPTHFQIRASVIDGVYSGPYTAGGSVVATIGQTAVKIEIESMSGQGLIAASQSGSQTWYVGLEEVGKTLFEQKLPRFSSRYKYEDNEYSAPGPFSEVVFIPGDFRYHPQEAYNTGMVNTLRELTLQDFIPSDLPKDVVQVDILYKNETSPNVYTIESITKEDTLVNGKNAWTSMGSKDGLFGSYKVSTENIYSTLPSNQLLRPWDNVPRTALAQEVSGNRIVYGNYLQNYDLIKAGSRIVPNITTTIGNRINNSTDNRGRKSIKSLRSYDIGVVWGDQYGRETPIITPSSGSTLVPKTKASNSNSLNVELDGNHPDWADYYKIFVKETSNEYYNLAMDRVYDAEDSNIWISFPSIDRNKVDEDTYLILKKGIDIEVAVEEEARYKIVAIENEAPEYIKTSYELLVESNDDATQRTHSGNVWGGQSGPSQLPSGSKNGPTPGQKGFSIAYNMWTKPWSVANSHYGLIDLVDLFDDIKTSGGKDLLVSFSRNDVGSGVFGDTKKYKVISLKYDDPAPTVFLVDIDEPILVEDEFITSSIENGNDYVTIKFWERKIENKPEFDGRFFVKILSDTVLKDKLYQTQTIDTNWMVDASTLFYNIEDTSLTYNTSLYSFHKDITLFPAAYAVAGSSPQANGNSSTKTQNQWETALKFGSSTIKSGWFIDKTSFASEQEYNKNDYHDVQTQWEFTSGADHVESCDTTSTVLTSFSFFNYAWAQLVGGFVGIDDACGDMDCNKDVGTRMSTGAIGMRGAFNQGGNNFLDLSYSKTRPSLTASANHEPNFTVGEDALQWGSLISASTNSDTDQEADVVGSLKPAQRFRIKGAPTIYKIISVTKKKLYNYRGATTGLESELMIGSWTGLPTSAVATYDDIEADHLDMGKDTNRRANYRIKYVVDLDAAPDPSFDPGTGLQTVPANWSASLPGNDKFDNVNDNPNTNNSATIEFISQFDADKPSVISSNPAIFETEPKEDADLDIYYEATNRIPTKFTTENQELFIPIGAVLEVDASVADVIPEGIFVTSWGGCDPLTYNATTGYCDPIDNVVNFSTPITSAIYNALNQVPEIKFVRDDGSFTSVTILSATGVSVATPWTFTGIQIEITNKIGLGWFNCWSFNNGVESNRIGDTYNKPFIKNGVKVSSVIVGNYEEEKRTNGLIYSGIYNPNSNTNELNQFIAAEKITKDLNPTYGSIQKLYSQTSAEGDLIALCEDRILKILANKDALYNADGNSQLVSTNNVLGRAIPFSGEYGISKNPESFASEAYRAYFTDKVRGAVMRLSKDGLTPVSDYGMKDWFRDNLKLANKLIGSYDDKKDEYNLTLKEMGEFTYTTTSEVVYVIGGQGGTPLYADIGVYAADPSTLYMATALIQVGDEVSVNSVSAAFFSVTAGTVVTSVTVTNTGLTVTLSNPVVDGTALIPFPWQVPFDYSREVFTTVQDPNSNPSETVSFKEDVKGWVSFKSFFPENAISVANEYYTFLYGNLWKHHQEGSFQYPIDRNTFYGFHTNSSFTVLLNDLPGSVKSFKTINYEGSQSKVELLESYEVYDAVNPTNIYDTLNDNEYYNLTAEDGWYVESIKTDKQKGSINEFIEKEGKWFNYIQGNAIVSDPSNGSITDEFI